MRKTFCDICKEELVLVDVVSIYQYAEKGIEGELDLCIGCYGELQAFIDGMKDAHKDEQL